MQKSFNLFVFFTVFKFSIYLKALRNNDLTTFDIETVSLMIRMFDKDNTGTIDVNEFCQLWKYLGDWRGSFDRFDRDGGGSIDEVSK